MTKNDNELVFSIERDDYEKLIRFQKKHEKCLEKMPNMTGGQFEYSFMPDSFGVFKSVTCICGERLLLDGDYETFAIKKDKDGKPKSQFKFQKEMKHKHTLELLRILKSIEKRPGMYFGKKPSWNELHLYICGMHIGSFDESEDNSDDHFITSEFSNVVMPVHGSVLTDIQMGKIKESDGFDLFFERLWEKIENEYPGLNMEE